jgi:hypothetical protein
MAEMHSNLQLYAGNRILAISCSQFVDGFFGHEVRSSCCNSLNDSDPCEKGARAPVSRHRINPTPGQGNPRRGFVPGQPSVSTDGADWILTRVGGLRASRCRDLNRQGDSQTGSELNLTRAASRPWALCYNERIGLVNALFV